MYSWVKATKDLNKEVLDSSIDKVFIIKNKKKHIVIKPNLCESISPETGATVGVETIKKIIDSLMVHEPDRISIVESDTSSRKIKDVYKFLGYDKLENDTVKLVNLSKEETIFRRINGLFFNEISIPRIFSHTDVFISVAKLKTHFEPLFPQKISCCLKNQFGCLPEPKKQKYHCVLDKVIVDINTAIKPDLCIIDGDIGMEGNAPIHGTPRKVGLSLLSNDVVSIDCIASRIMGCNPIEVPHLKLAIKSKLGEPYPYISNKDLLQNHKFGFVKQSLFDTCLYRIKRLNSEIKLNKYRNKKWE